MLNFRLKTINSFPFHHFIIINLKVVSDLVKITCQCLLYHTQNVITDISILFITNFVCVEMYVLSNKMNLYWIVTQMKLIPLTKLSSTNSPLQKTYRVMVWTRYGVFSQVLNPVRPSISVQGHFHSCQYNQIYQNSLKYGFLCYTKTQAREQFHKINIVS